MTDQNELLWNVYQEHCNWERHHEEQRSSVTNIFLAVAAGVLGIISVDGKLTISDVPLAIFLVIQGLFGSLFVAKQYERFRRHQNLADQYRQSLNDNMPGAKIQELRKAGDEAHKRKYPLLSRLRLYHMWIGLHLSFAIFGAVLVVIIIA